MKLNNLMAVTKKAAFAVMLTAAVSASVPAAPAQAAVMLNKKSVTMYAKQTVTLKLTGTKKKVKWTSTKAAVASINQKGKVTAKKAGKTVIRATVNKKSYTCRVTVKNPSLNKKSVTLEAWDIVKLELNGAVAETFASSNKAVASVNASGTVTAKAEGTAVITVTDTKGRTYTCIITVPAVQEDDSTDSSAASDNTGSASGSTNVQSPAVAQHVHDWVPHYSYAGNGKPVVDGYFCADVTCADNRGYGTDNGWRGETAPGYTSESGYGTGSTGTTQPSQDAAVNQPAGSNIGDNTGSQTGNDGNNTGNSGTNNNTQTQAPGAAVTEPEQPAAHAHSWTIPVLSADGLTLTGYKCAGCGEESHVHAWDTEVKVESGFSAGAVKGWKCACGEEISTEDYNRLVTANKEASESIKQAWVAANITAGMTDAQKVHKIAEEMHSWSYGPAETYAYPNMLRKALCASGNSSFADYCAAAGIQAEVVDVSQMTGIQDHYMAYVWVDGQKCITDATPGGGFTGPNIWTMEGFDLYCDMLDGAVTDEEFDAQIGQYEK